MGEQYRMILENATDEPWHFGVYQKHPSFPGLTSVALANLWRSTTSWKCPIISRSNLQWTMNYGVCIANFDKDQQKYTGQQFAPAYLSNVYNVVSLDGALTQSRLLQEVLIRSCWRILLVHLPLHWPWVSQSAVIAVEDSVGGQQDRCTLSTTSFAIETLF